MIVRNSLKKKIIISSIAICSGIFLIGAGVGGYYSSYNSNPYKNYYRTVATDSTQSFLSAYLAAKMDGTKLLLLPGFSLTPSLNLALNDPRFNNVGFLLIDDTYTGPSTTQVSSLNFRVDEGSFITGIAIGMYLNEYKDYFTKDDNKLTWGCYGGNNFPSVTSFMGGFQQGIDYFNKKIAKKSGLQEIEQVFLGEGLGDNFAGGFAPSDGNALIDKFLLKNLDCLIPVAGPQASAAASKIQQKGKRTVVIGVDSPLETDKTFANYKLPKDSSLPVNKCPTDIVPFSSLKKLDCVIPKVINIINKDKNPINNIGGLGYNSIGDVNNDGVGVSKAGEKYVEAAIKTISGNSSINNITNALNYIKSQVEFTRLGTVQYSVYYAKNNPEYVVTPNSSSRGTFTYSLQTSGMPMEPFNKDKIDPNANMSYAEWAEKASFSLVDFVKPNYQPDSCKIELILSTSNSVLLDSSFAQSSYVGMYTFFKENGINIPPIKG